MRGNAHVRFGERAGETDAAKARTAPRPDFYLERLNREIKRRCRVVGIFPTEASLIRLAGSVLIDTHEEWIATERRYFSEGSMAKLYPERDNDDATAELEPAR